MHPILSLVVVALLVAPLAVDTPAAAQQVDPLAMPDPAAGAAVPASGFAAGVLAWQDGDAARAVAIWQPLAEAGDAAAQYAMGVAHAQGLGATQNDGAAAAWYRRAAEQGTAEAQHALGFLYAAGRGVEPDPAEAARWYLAAAEQGHTAAQVSMGLVHELGLGVAENAVLALMWYALAAQAGMPEGETLYNELAARVELADIDAARRLAQERLMRLQQR